jgi:hypothetical protein
MAWGLLLFVIIVTNSITISLAQSLLLAKAEFSGNEIVTSASRVTANRPFTID